MKKIFLILAILILVSSCSENGTSGKNRDIIVFYTDDFFVSYDEFIDSIENGTLLKGFEEPVANEKELCGDFFIPTEMILPKETALPEVHISYVYPYYAYTYYLTDDIIASDGIEAGIKVTFSAGKANGRFNRMNRLKTNAKKLTEEFSPKLLEPLEYADALYYDGFENGTAYRIQYTKVQRRKDTDDLHSPSFEAWEGGYTCCAFFLSGDVLYDIAVSFDLFASGKLSDSAAERIPFVCGTEAFIESLTKTISEKHASSGLELTEETEGYSFTDYLDNSGFKK